MHREGAADPATVSEMFFAVVHRHASRPAIVEAGVTITFADLEERVLALIAHLDAQGVRLGASVAVVLPNGANFVSAYFACAALGAVVVPLSESYQEGELLRFFQVCMVSAVVTAGQAAPRCRAAAAGLEPPAALVVLDEMAADAWRPPAQALARVRTTSADAPAMYQLSSGSTGRPKRIARTHRQLLGELEALRQTLSFSPDDRFLGVRPFSHVNGLMRTMMSSVHAGAALYPLPKFDRQAVTATIEDGHLSVFIGVPFMFAMLAKAQFRRRPDLSSLRLCVSASAPLPSALNRLFADRFGRYVRQLYGSTETGSISVNMRADVAETLESVGRPLPGVEVRVRNAQGGEAAPGEVGEVTVTSPFAMSASGDGAHEALREGAFWTGDLGRRDQDGLLYLVGRKSLLINRGGYKVNPRDVEAVLESHPSVEEAVAIGVPTSYGDERIRAIIVANGPCTADELLEYCRSRIAPFKVPSVIDIRAELPKTPSGKIRRDALQ